MHFVYPLQTTWQHRIIKTAFQSFTEKYLNGKCKYLGLPFNIKTIIRSTLSQEKIMFFTHFFKLTYYVSHKISRSFNFPFFYFLTVHIQCTVGEKNKRNTPIYFITNYRTEMKLVPIIMDYCLLQFVGLHFFLGGLSAWGGVSA